MKKKLHIFILISFILTMILIGCTNKAPKDNHFNQLNRVDVEVIKDDGNDEESVMITDEETIDLLRKTFNQIKWEPNVQPSMDRKEDVKATIFFKYDQNMPERLFEYQIWFNPNHTATIISNNENENYGTLDKDHAQTLENILLNK